MKRRGYDLKHLLFNLQNRLTICKLLVGFLHIGGCVCHSFRTFAANDMKRIAIFALIGLFAQLNVLAQKTRTDSLHQAVCPVVKIQPEQLPSLNTPRSGHHTLYVNGEITVFGGHTAGFVPTSTAEYYKDGAWHQMNMVYTHDAGSALILKSGKVLLSGGFERGLGIGQSYEVEMYDPKTHTFDGFGCLGTKRASHTQVELDSGRVVITGNWYHEDTIEMYDGNITFTNIKKTSQKRALTNVFRIAPDDVIIFGGQDFKGHDFDTIIVDRLKGEPFTDPLFETWKPLHLHIAIHNDDSFIGDETKGIYSYLFPVKNKEGQLAIARADGTDFSLVPTTAPIPRKFEENTIIYYSQILVDRKAQKGYIMGNDSIHQTSSHIYILCIDYSPAAEGKPCPVTLYYTDPIPDFVDASPLITPEGNLLLTGGTGKKENPSHNFYPLDTMLLLHLGSEPVASSFTPALWIIGILLIIVFLVYLYLRHISRQKKLSIQKETEEVDVPQTHNPKTAANEELMQRIHQIVVEEKQFLNSELTVQSLARQMGIHRNYISSCVNDQKGCNFTQYVNAYRVEYAKQLMLQHPDLKMNAIALDSGFANDTSFFRTFRAFTDQTPSDWKNSNLSKTEIDDSKID